MAFRCVSRIRIRVFNYVSISLQLISDASRQLTVQFAQFAAQNGAVAFRASAIGGRHK